MEEYISNDDDWETEKRPSQRRNYISDDFLQQTMIPSNIYIIGCIKVIQFFCISSVPSEYLSKHL